MTTGERIVMDPQQSLPTKKCMKCGHEWIPRVPNPQRCPNCLSYDWDKEKEVEESSKGNISVWYKLCGFGGGFILERSEPFLFLDIWALRVWSRNCSKTTSDVAIIVTRGKAVQKVRPRLIIKSILQDKLSLTTTSNSNLLYKLL